MTMTCEVISSLTKGTQTLEQNENCLHPKREYMMVKPDGNWAVEITATPASWADGPDQTAAEKVLQRQTN